MEPGRQYHRTLDRLLRAADQDLRDLYKAMPKDFKERVTRREEKVIVVFLMNLHARRGKFPGEFRQELRRIMLRELANWAGLEVDFGDEAPAAQLPTIFTR